MPTKRLLPGHLFAEIEEHGRMTLTLVSDEGPDAKLSSAFLGACGLRTRFEKDFLHRLVPWLRPIHYEQLQDG